MKDYAAQFRKRRRPMALPTYRITQAGVERGFTIAGNVAMGFVGGALYGYAAAWFWRWASTAGIAGQLFTALMLLPMAAMGLRACIRWAVRRQFVIDAELEQLARTIRAVNREQ